MIQGDRPAPLRGLVCILALLALGDHAASSALAAVMPLSSVEASAHSWANASPRRLLATQSPADEVIPTIPQLDSTTSWRQLLQTGLSTTSATDLYFAAAAGTTSAAQSVTIINRASSPVTVRATISGQSSASFRTTTTCPTGTATLAVGASCFVSITFTAPPKVGAVNPVQTATLTVSGTTAANSATNSLTFNLKGNGPVFSIASGVVVFGTTTPGTPTTQLVTVTNNGGETLVISTIATPTTADFTITTVAPVSINAGQSATIGVKFKPINFGARTASFTMKHNDLRLVAPANGGTTTLSLSGTGDGDTFNVNSGKAVDFSKVKLNTAKSLTVNIANTGKSRAVTITAINVIASGATTANQVQSSYFTISNGAGCLGTILQPGKNCSITVQFKPTATGSALAKLSVKGDDNSLPPTVTTDLLGTGV